MENTLHKKSPATAFVPSLGIRMTNRPHKPLAMLITLTIIATGIVAGGWQLGFAGEGAAGRTAPEHRENMPDRHHGMKKGGHGGPLAWALEQKDLTAEQRSKIEALRKSRKELQQERRQERMKMHQDIHAVLAGSTVDEVRFQALKETAKAAAAEAMGQHLDTMHALASILTAEQKARMPEGPMGQKEGPQGPEVEE